jgi:hypothetical protein
MRCFILQAGMPARTLTTTTTEVKMGILGFAVL